MVDSRGHFVWYDLMTTDVEAAKAFYVKVVGWGTEDAPMPGKAYTLFTVRGASVAGLMELPEDAKRTGAEPTWTGFVGVDDVDATTDRIRALGGSVHVPPQDIPNISRFSVVADPQMATFVLVKWLRPRREQPAQPNTLGRVGWHELLTADWEKAFAFYSKIFGWKKPKPASPLQARVGQLFSAGGQMIGGMVTKPPNVPVSFWLYHFNVGDIDAAAKRVNAGGGQILGGPLEVPGGRWIIECADPQGAIFALTEKRGPRAGK